MKQSNNLSLKMRGGRERQVVREASFTSRFDIDKITQIGWFRFMDEIVSIIYMILYCMHCSTLKQ